MVVLTAKVRAPQPRGLQRQRLLTRLGAADNWRIAVISAPAGSGKTTLAAQHAAGSAIPTAWLQVEPSEAAARAFLEHVARTLSDAARLTLDGNGDLDVILRALELKLTSPILLVIDDAHVLCGAPAEATLERFVRLAPAQLHIVIAGRRIPDINLPRLQLDEEVLEITGEDLRFRAWEAERLLREIYEEPLPPEDVAKLVRRMDGWAAGLQLFHLATRGRSLDARRSELGRLLYSSRLTRSYLVCNVLAGLPAHLTYFLTRTSVLDVLSGKLCDRLLATTGSQQVLEDLAQAQMFTQSADDGTTFSYHQVLRDHLGMSLLDEIGEPAVVEWRRRAATALEADGHITEAVGALARIDAWEDVARLLRAHGPRLAGQPATWTDIVPPELRENDPWLTLGEARRTLASGSIREAHRHYRRAEELGLGQLGHDDLGWEIAEAFAPDASAGTSTWARRLRLATRRPPAQRDRTPGPSGSEELVADGLIALLAGDARTAAESFGKVADDASPAGLVTVARLGGALASWTSSPTSAELLEQRALEAYVTGGFWLARVAGLLAAVRRDDPDAILALQSDCRRDNDDWGVALADLGLAITGLRQADHLVALRSATQAAARFDALDAPVLAAWCQAIGVHAQPTQDQRRDSAAELERRGRTLGVPAVRAVALSAGTAADQVRGQDLAQDCGLDPMVRLRRTAVHIDAGVPTGGVGTAPSGPALVVRCFGAFRLTVGGREPSLSALRPKARSLLHLLCLSAGKPVHREVLLDYLWPEQSPDAALHGLHVAVSALRKAIEPAARRGESQIIVRTGSSYTFAVGPDSDVDVIEFDRAVAGGAAARRSGELAAARELFARALAIHVDDLLLEEGPAEWVVAPRDERRRAATEAAASLAELCMESDDLPSALEAAMSAVRLDPLLDTGWRHLEEAHRRGGDLAAAEQASRRHQRILLDLGVAVPEQRQVARS